MFGKSRVNGTVDTVASSPEDKGRQPALADDLPPIDATGKSTWDRLWPTFACGAGLFSDGYLQSVIGPVNTCFKKIYGAEYKNSPAYRNIPSIAFVGTVVGQLVFGFTSDHYSRKWSLLTSTLIMFVFAALATGAYGANGSHSGLFAALTAYRFLLGLGLGGEYPAGSVGAAESSGEIKAGQRNRWFCLFTNTQIDLGFVIGYIVPMIVAAITPNLGVVWRVSLGIGVIPPLSLLFLRLKLKEPESYSRNSFKGTKTPYLLALKFYGWRLLLVCGIWFIYDFLAYPFGIYSSVFTGVILGDSAPFWQVLGWGALVNFFYLPGAIVGAFTSDWLGPRRATYIFVIAQGIIAFILSGCLYYLEMKKYIAAFVVLYGIFLALGEVGPGDNIGLIASKTCATGIRGQYYAIAAACGKIGGYIGTYVFPIIQADGGSSELHTLQYPFYVGGALCFVSALLVYFLPHIGQDTIDLEDIRFRAYLEEHGWDTSHMGDKQWQERRASVVPEQEK